MNLSKLYKRLTDPIENFEKLGDCTHTEHGPMIFIDNNAPVLAVGHLDWVMFGEPKLKKQFKNTLIYDCPQLDDRLGVWMILDVLPKAGIKCDILLTDNEECGHSTANHFETNKQYNWMMEFDRAGGGVVMYDYEDKFTRDLLSEYDFKLEQGSYSDIGDLESLGCKGFNFGVGYHKQHTTKCYANLAETWDSFRKVQSLYEDWADTLLEHDKTMYRYQPIRYYNTYASDKGSIQTYRPNGTKQTTVRSTYTPKIKQQKLPSITKERDYTPELDEIQALDDIALDKYSRIYCYCTDKQKKAIMAEYEDQFFNL